MGRSQQPRLHEHICTALSTIEEHLREVISSSQKGLCLSRHGTAEGCVDACENPAAPSFLGPSSMARPHSHAKTSVWQDCRCTSIEMQLHCTRSTNFMPNLHSLSCFDWPSFLHSQPFPTDPNPRIFISADPTVVIISVS